MKRQPALPWKGGASVPCKVFQKIGLWPPQSNSWRFPTFDLPTLTKSVSSKKSVMFPQLTRFTDLGLLLMRMMVGLVFVTSGYSHLKDPTARAKSIEMSKDSLSFSASPNLPEVWA